jgi:hypothetical protein
MIAQSPVMVKHASPKRLLPRTWKAERLGDGPQEVALVGLLQQLDEWHPSSIELIPFLPWSR